MTPSDTPPLCSCHGVPKVWRRDTRKRSGAGGCWRCVVKESNANRSAAKKARQARYLESTIRLHIGDEWYNYRVPPERKSELRAKIQAFRSEQEDSVGRIDPAIP